MLDFSRHNYSIEFPIQNNQLQRTKKVIQIEQLHYHWHIPYRGDQYFHSSIRKPRHVKTKFNVKIQLHHSNDILFDL